MRITNTSGARRLFSYVGAGGRVLGNGETSQELPPSLLVPEGLSDKVYTSSVNVEPSRTLWNDIDAGHVTVTFSAADRVLMAKIIALDPA